MEPLWTIDDLPGGLIGKIYADEIPESPREWSNLGTFALFHHRYSLPNETDIRSNDYDSWDEIEAEIRRIYDPVALLAIRGYDHSGFSISTSNGYPYNCPWDSGMIGFAFVSREAALAAYGHKIVTARDKVNARARLEQEIEIYNQYLNGDVYGFVLETPEGDKLDSCWGYFGEDSVEDAVRESAKWYAAEREKEAAALQQAMFPPFPFFDRFPVLAVL